MKTEAEEEESEKAAQIISNKKVELVLLEIKATSVKEINLAVSTKIRYNS